MSGSKEGCCGAPLLRERRGIQEQLIDRIEGVVKDCISIFFPLLVAWAALWMVHIVAELTGEQCLRGGEHVDPDEPAPAIGSLQFDDLLLDGCQHVPELGARPRIGEERGRVPN